MSSATRGVVNGYIDCYNEWIETDQTALEWATDHCASIKGLDCDERPMNTVRINIGYIAWAEENIIGGASACASMNHIIKTISNGKTTKAPQPVYEYKTRTLDGKTLVKELVANGVSRKQADAIAKKLGFRK